jgi:phosphoribosylaminoimidazole carboxylase PurE protein
MTNQPLVGIAMGSSSDLPTLEPAIEILTELGVPHEVRVLSAHRTPERMTEYAKRAHERGLKAIIAGAGGAAHLPGMIAASTPLPVIGVPVNTSSGTIGGIDALLSIAQMPRGVPVATVAIGGGMNAGILAAQIVAASDTSLLQRIVEYKKSLAEKVYTQDEDVQRRDPV